MKRVISLVVLIVVLASISCFTIYTLSNKGIREEVTKKVTKKIEQVTSNMSYNNLSEIYNVYLNQEKHKVKLEYVYTNENQEKDISAFTNLVVYYDGKTILNEIISLKVVSDLEELFLNEDEYRLIKLTEENLKIFSVEEQDYLLLELGYNVESIKKKYFIFDGNGDILNDEGILVFDTSKYYVNEDDTFLDIFYESDGYQVLSKIDRNVIYALEEKSSKKKLKLEEYKYFIKKGKLEKELLNTYENIKLQVIEE